MAPSSHPSGLSVAAPPPPWARCAAPRPHVALLDLADFAARSWHAVLSANPARPARNTRGLGAGLRASAADRRVLDGFAGPGLARGRLTPTVALDLGRALVAPTRSPSRPQEPA